MKEERRRHSTIIVKTLVLLGVAIPAVLIWICPNGMDLKAEPSKTDMSRKLRGHRGWITDVCYSPDGRRLASSGVDHTVRLWEVSTGRIEKIFRGHNDEVFKVVFSPDGRFLVSSSLDRSVIVRYAKSGKAKYTHHLPTYSTAIDIAADNRLAIGTRDGDITIQDILSHKTIVAWENRVPEADTKFPIWSLSFSPDGQFLATSGPIVIWESGTGKLWRSYLRPGAVHTLTFSQDGKLLASAHWNGEARIWKIDSNIAKHVLQEKGTASVQSPSGMEQIKVALPLSAVAFSPDGIHIATAGADKLIRLWDINSGELIRTLRGHTAAVASLCYSPDGKQLASAGLDAMICLWPTTEP